MLINAKVSKLYRHMGDPRFESVMSEIQAASEEGMSNFELDVSSLDEEMVGDLLDALDALQYEVAYHPEAELMEVNVS